MYDLTEHYDAIFRRKSFHLFHGVGDDRITEDELAAIGEAWGRFVPLCPEIKTEIRIVPARRVNFRHGAEYCVLIYSEKKENWLMNAGYVGEQFDLWLVEHHIGSLWCGLCKPDEATFDGLAYVIMFAIHKVNDDGKYRKDMFAASRKPTAEVWSGDEPGELAVARFAPSACNSQPWYVESRDGTLTVSRHKKPGKIGILSDTAALYFNRIDLGIYLCFLEICMQKSGIGFDRTLFPDDGGKEEMTKVASYRLVR